MLVRKGLIGLAVATAMCVPTLSARAAPGDPDPGFGTGGVLSTGLLDQTGAVDVDAQGRVLVAGVKGGLPAVARFTSTGLPDTTFSEDGVATFGVPAQMAGGKPQPTLPIGVGALSNGTVLVATANFLGAQVARFTPTGQLDVTYGAGSDEGEFGDGTPGVIFFETGGSVGVQSTSISPDGSIVMTAVASFGGGFVWRADPSGVAGGAGLDFLPGTLVVPPNCTVQSARGAGSTVNLGAGRYAVTFQVSARGPGCPPGPNNSDPMATMLALRQASTDASPDAILWSVTLADMTVYTADSTSSGVSLVGSDLLVSLPLASGSVFERRSVQNGALLGTRTPLPGGIQSVADIQELTDGSIAVANGPTYSPATTDARVFVLDAALALNPAWAALTVPLGGAQAINTLAPTADGGFLLGAGTATAGTVRKFQGPPPTPMFPPSALAPLQPGRLLDTRAGGQTVDHQFEAQGIRPAGEVLELQVGGRGGVPADADAAVLNVTVTGATGNGYVTAWPCGQPQPNASSLNFVGGSTVANSVIVKLGAGGKVCLVAAESATHLIADVNGFFPAGSGFSPVQPGRLLDTRTGGQTVDHQFEAQGIRGAGSILELQVGGRGGVAADATSAVLNVTVTGATGPGYVTVWPCGQPQPNASSLNFVTDSTVPNAVVSQVGAGGKVCLFVAESATHLLADVNGFFPVGAGYAPLQPGRLLDTRGGGQTVDHQFEAQGIREAGSILELQIGGRGSVPTNAAAAVLNVTVTGATGGGYVTVWPCGEPQPNASSLNYMADATVPNAVVVKLGTAGKVCLFVAESATHLIADVNGYFPG